MFEKFLPAKDAKAFIADVRQDCSSPCYRWLVERWRVCRISSASDPLLSVWRLTALIYKQQIIGVILFALSLVFVFASFGIIVMRDFSFAPAPVFVLLFGVMMARASMYMIVRVYFFSKQSFEDIVNLQSFDVFCSRVSGCLNLSKEEFLRFELEEIYRTADDLTTQLVKKEEVAIKNVGENHFVDVSISPVSGVINDRFSNLRKYGLLRFDPPIFETWA